MHGGSEKREFFDVCFVSTGVYGGGRGTCVEENGHGSQSLEEWEDLAGLYILLPLPSAG